MRRSALWWVAAVMYLSLSVGLIVTFGWVYGVALAMLAGGAALASYWKVRD